MQVKRKLLEERVMMRESSEPAKRKSHWDFVLEEMQWMANDFFQVSACNFIIANTSIRWFIITRHSYFMSHLSSLFDCYVGNCTFTYDDFFLARGLIVYSEGCSN